jgi:hypothetical protein
MSSDFQPKSRGWEKYLFPNKEKPALTGQAFLISKFGFSQILEFDTQNL